MTDTFNTVSTEIPARLFVDINKLVLKFPCKGKETRMAKMTSKKNNKIEGITLPD